MFGVQRFPDDTYVSVFDKTGKYLGSATNFDAALALLFPDGFDPGKIGGKSSELAEALMSMFLGVTHSVTLYYDWEVAGTLQVVVPSFNERDN